MTVNEALSRLLGDDLPPDEAARWHARIASDDEVRRAWVRLQHLAHDLESEPEPAVPDHLMTAAVAASASSPTRAWSWRSVRGGVLAAALAWFTWAAWPEPSPTLTLVHGEQQVQGTVDVVAGGIPVHVEGVASILVQPAERPLRVGSQEAPMQWSSAIGFGAGVVVTVAVSQGVAWFQDPQGAVIHVPAGETRVVAGRAAATASRSPQPTSAATDNVEGSGSREAELEASIESLTFERDLLRGQVTSLQGPLSWPSGYTTELQPGKFEQGIRAALREMGEVVDVDCSAYPCLALVEVDDDDAMAVATEVAKTVRLWVEQLEGDDELNMGVSLAPHGEHTRVGIVVSQEGDHDHPEVKARVADLMDRP